MHRGRLNGFTLVETLLVIILITGIVGFFAYNMRSSQEQMALTKTEKLVASLLQSARSAAILNNTLVHKQSTLNQESLTARLIIHNNPDEPARYRRYVGIVYGSAISNEWLPAQGGVYLPDGLYLDAPKDSIYQMHLSYPEIEEGQKYLSSTKSGGNWLYMEFDDTGSTVAGSGVLLLGIGDTILAGSSVEAIEWNEYLKTQLQVNRYGQVKFQSNQDLMPSNAG